MSQIEVVVDERGFVRDANNDRLIGRTIVARPPRPDAEGSQAERLEVRGLQSKLLGWVESAEGGSGFSFSWRSLQTPAEIAEFQALVSQLSVAPAAQGVQAAVRAAQDIVPRLAGVSPAQAIEFESAVMALLESLEKQFESVDEALTARPRSDEEEDEPSADDDATLFMESPLMTEVAAGAILASEAAAEAGLKEAGKIVLKSGKELTKPEIIRTGQSVWVRIGSRLVPLVLSPGAIAGAVGTATLAAQIFILWGIAEMAAEGIKAVLLRLIRGVEQVWEDLYADLFAELADAGFIGFDDIPCVADCLDQLRADMLNVFNATRQDLEDMNGISLTRLNDRINKALWDFLRCLIDNCGIDPQEAYALYLWLADKLERGPVGWAIGGLGFGRLSIPLDPEGGTGELPPDARNVIRKHARKGNLEGYHRRGGFSFEEFASDEEENPDISSEDPEGSVGLEEIEPNAALRLERFRCPDLLMRVQWLRARLSELRQLRRDLIGEIRAAISRRDDGERSTILSLQNQILSLNAEIVVVASALQNALKEMLERPCPELSPSELGALAEQSGEAIREVQSGPVFKADGDWFKEIRPEVGR